MKTLSKRRGNPFAHQELLVRSSCVHSNPTLETIHVSIDRGRVHKRVSSDTGTPPISMKGGGTHARGNLEDSQTLPGHENTLCGSIRLKA